MSGMFEIYVIGAIALLAAGAMIGFLMIFAVGIHREEKARSLRNANPGRIASGLRVVMDTRIHPQVPELAGHR
jgi:hypothetical protein